MTLNQAAKGRYILAIDEGTTGATALVVDASDPKTCRVIGRATVDFPQHYPHPGWVEHDLEEIWTAVRQAVTTALAQASRAQPMSAHDLAAIGITNQRETLCVFDRKTAKPLARAIVWQCKRSNELCAEFKRQGHEANVKDLTGLVLDPYFSATKITWLMENNANVAAAVQKGQAVFGTIDTYLLARLTAAKSYATEPSNASRTLLYNINKGEFDPELLKLFRVPSRDALPEVKDSAALFGKTQGLDFLPDGIPITGILGDQQAALAGQTCFQVGEAKCTYGTGAFLLVNTGSERLVSRFGLLTTVAWSLKGKRTYAFEGAAFVAGAAVQFLRDQLGLIKNAADTEGLAMREVAAPDLYFVPALAGLGVPYWNPAARGAFLGMTRGTTKAQLVRATLEGMALQVHDLLQAMAKDSSAPLRILRVDGGAAANGLLMQIQADIANITVERPRNLETTGFGAALFAGLGAGVFADLQQLQMLRDVDRHFSPDTSPAAKARFDLQRAGWQRAVKAVEVFANRDA